MYRRSIALFILFIACYNSRAQSPTRAQAPTWLLRGTVQDSVSKLPLEDATVSLLHLPDTTLLHTVRSSKNGFLFRSLHPGSYLIVTTYLGYAPDTVQVLLTPADSAGKRIPVRLQPSARALMEVVVHANIPPAIVRNDTIAFNAAAYPTRPNATVEDLLRKLPGIDIDKNGNVTMQGQKVDKIYLDGKEFFLNDPRTATQNLPADIVDQIEAFDSETERARLMGIKESTGTKSLNIKLKKNRKKGYFGKIYAGTGTDGSGTSSGTGTTPGGGPGTSGPPGSTSNFGHAYSAGGTVTNLGTSWIFGTGNLNNINNQFTGSENKNGPGSGGVQTFNNAQLNFRTNKNNLLTLTLNAGTNGSHTTLDQSTRRNTFLSDSSLLENRYSHSVSRNQSYHVNAFLEYTPDSFTTVNLRSIWTPQNSSSDAMDTVSIDAQKPSSSYRANHGFTDNNNHTDGYSLNNTLNFRRRWRRPGRTFFASLTQSFQRQDQPALTFSRIDNFDSTNTLLQHLLIDQRSDQASSGNSLGGSLSYTEPLRPGHLLDFNYSINRSVSHSDKQSSDYDSATGNYDRPDTLTTNHFINYNTVQRVGAGYNATDGHFRYQLGVTLQLSDLNDHNLTNHTTINQHQVNWYPRASLIYTPVRGRTLKVDYSANTTSPTIQQLQPLPDLTNPFLVRVGNPDLLQQLTHQLAASYAALNTRSFRNLQVGLQGDLSEHQIIPSTTILSGGIQQIRYVNVDGAWHLSSHITYGFPLGDQRKGNSSINIHARYGRDISLLNGARDYTNNLGWGGLLKLNYHPAGKLFVEGTAAVDYTGAQYSLYPAQNTMTWQQNYSLDASYELPWAITITSWYNLQVTGRQGSLPTRQVSLWNASIYKDLFRNRSAQIRFSAFGLLNTASNYTQTVGVNYVETRQTNLPGRIFLLSFVYRFRHFY